MVQLIEVVDFKGLMHCVGSSLGLANENPTTEEGNSSAESDQTQSESLTPASSELKVEAPFEQMTIEQIGDKITAKTAQDRFTQPEVAASFVKNTVQPDDTASATGSIMELSARSDLKIVSSKVHEAFQKVNRLTNKYITDHGGANHINAVIPQQNRLYVALAVEASEQLNCPLRTAEAGQELERIKDLPQHKYLVDLLYTILQQEAHLVTVDVTNVTRTAIGVPAQSSKITLDELLSKHPENSVLIKLSYHAGSQMASFFSGACDGPRLPPVTEEASTPAALVAGLRT